MHAFKTFLWLAVFIFAGIAQARAETATLVSNIDFGIIDAPSGGTGTVRAGTNGSVTYPAGYSGSGTAIVGRIQISNSTVGRALRISCEASKTARNTTGTGGTQDRTASPFFIVLGTANAVGPGQGTQCAGIGTSPISGTYSATSTANVVLIGVDLTATNPAFGGLYSLANAPDGRLTVRVRFQGGGPAVEVDVQVDMTAVFRGILSIPEKTDMDFGEMQVSGTIASGDWVNLGTNAARSFTGNFNGAGAGTAGRIRVAGPSNGETIDVFCDSTARMTRSGGGGQIDVTGIEVAAETSRGNYGTGSACQGVAIAATSFSYTLDTRDELYFGGRINGGTASGQIRGNFSSANAGGNNIEIIVVRQ